MRIRIATLAVILSAMTAARPVSADQISIANDNVIVTGNLTENNEIMGKTYVGGNISGNPTNFAFGNGTALSGDTLVVGGSINTTNSFSLAAGTLRYGVSIPNNINYNGGSSSVHDTTVQNIGTTIGSYLTGLSNAYNNLASTNTTALPAYTYNSSNQQIVFNAVAGSSGVAGQVAGVAVIDVSGSVFNSASTPNISGYNINVGAGVTSIIFNVSGSSVTFNESNFTGNLAGTYRQETLFNFNGATTVTSNLDFTAGSILAPSATYTNTSDNEAGVFVGNAVLNNEVHLPTNGSQVVYSGYVPSSVPVPEPAAVVSTLSGLIILGGTAWRRRRRQAA